MLPTAEEFQELKDITKQINNMPRYRCTLIMKGDFKRQNVILRISSPKSRFLVNITDDDNKIVIKRAYFYMENQRDFLNMGGTKTAENKKYHNRNIAVNLMQKSQIFKNINFKGE